MRYSFVGDNNLNASLRVIMKEKSGTIQGSFKDDSESNAEKIVVYAYKKGTFNASTETQAQSDDKIMFKNAVTSAEVKSSLTNQGYTLAFLEEGEYELHFVAYNRSTENGRFMYSAHLQSETSVNGSIANVIKVKAGAAINIASPAKGIF
jgi:hypothetical protein